jgi:hypothetical protein
VTPQTQPIDATDWVLGGWEPEEHPWTPLFERVFAGCEGLVELRTFAADRLVGRLFCEPTDIGAVRRFALDHRQHDVYFGVATRRDASAGTLRDCRHLGALFADIDFKTLPEKEARAELARCLLPPTVIVQSGGGLHVYWTLREPLELPDEANEAYRLLRKLTAFLNADPSAAEPARVLRLPGTFNVKPIYPVARLVQIERAA